MKKIVPTITGKTPNENREVVLYDHFVGDNSSLKFIIKFRKKKKVFLTSFYALSLGFPSLKTGSKNNLYKIDI